MLKHNDARSHACMFVRMYIKTGASINFSVKEKEHETSVEAHFS